MTPGELTDRIMDEVAACVPNQVRNTTAYRRLHGKVRELLSAEFPRRAAPGGRQESPRR